MSKTPFLRRFGRGLPRVASLAFFALVAVAVTNDLRASRESGARAALMPLVTPDALRGIGEWTSPRECDVLAGISTDCEFMD